ncbi:MAG: hypothetical protein K2O42_06365 [Oscillospiraceae bacterium]|nr:hypothetical protein [Oscillospiraceae bacterium]
MERNYVVMACKEFEKENVHYAFDLWQSNPKIDMRESKTRESIIEILREIYKSKEHIISFCYYCEIKACYACKQLAGENMLVTEEEAYRQLEKIHNDVNYGMYSLEEMADDIWKKFKLLLKEKRKLMKELEEMK